MKHVSCLLVSLLAFGPAVSATRSPVEKVVQLIEELKGKIQGDAKAEQQAYDKYACWCQTTTKRKAESIVSGGNSLRALGQQILSLKGKIATLGSEISELAADIAANQQAQKEATAIREKQNAAYAAETTETKEALAAMQKAVMILVGGADQSKDGAALLQAATASKAAVQNVVEAIPAMATLTEKQVQGLGAFVQGQGTSNYAPQSLTIQGILKDMYMTFATDLEDATSTEASRNTNFEKDIAEKTAALKQDQADKADKEAKKAEAETQLADTTQNYDDTAAQKEADTAFFDETKAACEQKSGAWNLRSAARTEELSGIDQALTILTSDDARALFSKSIKPGKETGMDASKSSGSNAFDFLQVKSDSSAVGSAYAALRAGAKKAHSLRLAAIAVEVREAKAGHFAKVLDAIDGVIAELKAEGAEDIEKRDQCKDEYKNIESTVKDESWEIKKNTAKIDKLVRLIEKRTGEKAQAISDLKDVNQTMIDMKAQRKTENEEFLQAKTDDTNAIALLVSARTALTSYTTNHSIDMGAFIQQPEFAVSEDQAPDTSFSGKGSHKHESKGINSLLTMIIEDLDDEIRNGMSAEENAQVSFEKALATAEKLEEDLLLRKTNLESAIGRRTEERDDEAAEQTVNEADLKEEKDYRVKIKPDCDWIIGSFTERAGRREAEMNGLQSAKEYLVGKAPELIETTQTFDDSKLSKINFLGVRH